MWKSTFSWHIEDMDLYGANYNHFRAAKIWYIVPPKYVNEMEQLCKEKFSKYWDCKGMIRHKNFLISPKVLAERNIPCYKNIQEPGDLMIVFPKTFHCGFNAGLNGCEEVNFATKNWKFSVSLSFSILDYFERSWFNHYRVQGGDRLSKSGKFLNKFFEN